MLKLVIRDWNHKLLEACSFKIGIHLIKLWPLDCAVLGHHFLN